MRLGLRTRGTTLVEIMVAVVLLVLIGSLVLQLLLVSQRHLQGVADRLAMTEALRGAMQVFTEELRAVGGQGTGNPDLLTQAVDSVRYRIVRGVSRVCEVDSAAGALELERGGYSLRLPSPGRDTLALHLEQDPTLTADDQWVSLSVDVVSTAAKCPNGLPAIRVSSAGLLGTIPGGLSSGAPVEWFEVMALREYRSAGQSWLGGQSVSAGEIVQPIAGPLAGAGLSLRFEDGMGSPSGGAGTRVVGVHLSILPDPAHATGAGVRSRISAARGLVAAVALRNVP